MHSSDDIQTDQENDLLNPNIDHLKNKRPPLQTIKLNFDEAISKTKFGLFNYVLIFVSGLVILSMVTEKNSIAYIFSVSQCDLNLTSSAKGFLGSVNSLGMICSFHLWGFLADTLGRRCIIQYTLVAAFFTSVISSLVQNFYILSAMRFFNGFLISASSATIYAFLSEFHTTSKRSLVIMVSGVLLSVICILLPISAYGVINQSWQFDIPWINITYKPWRLFFIVCALPELIAFAIIVTIIPESPKFLFDSGKSEEAHNVLQKMNRWNNGRHSQLEPFEIVDEKQQRNVDNDDDVTFIKSVWNQTIPLFEPPLLRSTVLICLVQFSLLYTAQGVNVFFVDILNKIAVNSDNLVDKRMSMCKIINSKSTAQLNKTMDTATSHVCIDRLEITMIQQGILLQVLILIGFIVITFFINRISKYSIMVSILIGGGACAILCMWIDIPLLQMFLFTIVLVSGTGSQLLSTVTVELYPTNLRAMAVCISFLIGRIGCMLGSNLTGILLENHCEIAFYISGTLLIGSAALAFFIPNIHQKVANS